MVFGSLMVASLILMTGAAEALTGELKSRKASELVLAAAVAEEEPDGSGDDTQYDYYEEEVEDD